MEKLRQNIVKGVFTLTMVMFLWLWMGTTEVNAANFYKPIIDTDTITLYPSGCLKDITITVQATKYYAPAYGRIGIHKGITPYN